MNPPTILKKIVLPKPTKLLRTSTLWTARPIVFDGRLCLEKGFKTVKKDFFYGFSLPPTSFHFNTVQGYNANINFFYNRNWEKKMKSLGIKLYNTFGFSDRENYPGLLLDYLMNRIYSRFYLSTETRFDSFDDQQPIRLLMNDINSLFFKRKFCKMVSK